MSERAVLRLELPDRLQAPAAARKALTALNGSLHLVSEARLHDTQLIVTELVSNAVRHGPGDGAPVSLTVYADERAMRVEVRDSGGGFEPEALGPPGTDRSGGWGLPIVAALAHRWGVRGGEETTVWFEIDRPAHEAPIDASPIDAE